MPIIKTKPAVNPADTVPNPYAPPKCLLDVTITVHSDRRERVWNAIAIEAAPSDQRLRDAAQWRKFVRPGINVYVLVFGDPMSEAFLKHLAQHNIDGFDSWEGIDLTQYNPQARRENNDAMSILANIIAEHPDQTTTWYARAANYSRTHATRVLNDLAANGILQRTRDESGYFTVYRWRLADA